MFRDFGADPILTFTIFLVMLALTGIFLWVCLAGLKGKR